jgi:hypothetical protein
MTTTNNLSGVGILEVDAGRIVLVSVTGKLHKEDYEAFVPEIERLTQKHGTIRALVELIDFHGWTIGALWEDTKFAARHFSDIERLAIVGERQWEKGMAVFCKPFTRAHVRYFDRSQKDRAVDWLRERDSD